MSKLGMGSLAVLTAGGILSALNMRRVTKQRERTMTRAMRRTEWALAHWPWDLSAAGSGLGLLGRNAEASAREALIVRASVLAAVWWTLFTDVRGSGLHANYLIPYTRWNFVLLGIYAPIAFAASCQAFFFKPDAPANTVAGQRQELGWAGRAARRMFPLIATGALTVDIGYFVFLHGPIAMGAKLSGWEMTKGMDPRAMSMHLLNSFWMLAELGIGRMEIPTRSALHPFALNCIYVVFAYFHNKVRGSWVYAPLAVPAWRVAFPLAVLPVWAILAQLTVWRDTAAEVRLKGGPLVDVFMGLVVKLAVVLAVVGEQKPATCPLQQTRC